MKSSASLSKILQSDFKDKILARVKQKKFLAWVRWDERARHSPFLIYFDTVQFVHLIEAGQGYYLPVVRRWHSGESDCLPPVWPGFEFRIQHRTCCWFSALPEGLKRKERVDRKLKQDPPPSNIVFRFSISFENQYFYIANRSANSRPIAIL